MGIFGEKSKRGNSPLELITIILIITALAIGSIFAMKVFDDVNTDIQADDSMGADAKAISSSLYLKYPSTLDSAIMMAFVLFIIFVIISVFMLDTHPVFFVVSVIIIIAVFIVTMLIANVYDDVMLDEDFSPYASQFVYTGWIMSHILELSVAIGFIVLIVLFIKFRG